MNGYVRILCVSCSTFHYSPTETAISNVSCAVPSNAHQFQAILEDKIRRHARDLHTRKITKCTFQKTTTSFISLYVCPIRSFDA